MQNVTLHLNVCKMLCDCYRLKCREGILDHVTLYLVCPCDGLQIVGTDANHRPLGHDDLHRAAETLHTPGVFLICGQGRRLRFYLSQVELWAFKHFLSDRYINYVTMLHHNGRSPKPMNHSLLL